MDTYGISSFDTYVAVVTVPEGETVEEEQADVAAVFDAVREVRTAARGSSTSRAPATRASSPTTAERRSP